MSSKIINNLMLSIVRGQLENKKFIIFCNTGVVYNLLCLLCDEGLILSFILSKNNLLIIYLKYYGSSPVISNLNIYKKKSYRNSLTKKKLKKLIFKNPSSIFILNTSYGFITQSVALNFKFLGPLCFKIN